MGEVGLVLMGIGSLSNAGMIGAVYQLFILGLSLSGFGLLFGIIYNRVKDQSLLSFTGDKRLKGLAQQTPFIAIVAGFVVSTLLGFPGFAGFIGKAFILIGTFPTHPLTAIFAGFAFVLSAYGLFAMYRSLFLGETVIPFEDFPDLTLREKAYLFPIVGSLIFFGFYPKPLIDLIQPTILTLLSTVK
jgi:NADH-quinone oxidoreductase subunit M